MEAKGKYLFIGVGFVFTAEYDIIGIDIDHCLVDGQPNEVASAILQKLPPTYIEISPGGSDKTSLIKARYHFFLRALEGAFVTLNHPRRLFLNRRSAIESPEAQQAVFEVSVCSDCGRLALVGGLENGFLRQNARQFDDRKTQYYLITDTSDGDMYEDGDDQDSTTSEGNYAICPVYGAMVLRTDAGFHPLPNDMSSSTRQKSQIAGEQDAPLAISDITGGSILEATPRQRCWAPSFLSSFRRRRSRRLYLRWRKARAAFSPANRCRAPQQKPRCANSFAFPTAGVKPRFLRPIWTNPTRNFCADGIWHVAELLRSQNRTSVSVREFVDELIRYFSDSRTFVQWDTPDNRAHDTLYSESKSNAWIAILNEMYNARRGTSLVAMGVIVFEYTRNDDVADSFAESYSLSISEARALLELLVLDGVYTGAIVAGDEHRLSDAEREYIFFAKMSKKLKLLKNAGEPNWISGWRGRQRSNGSLLSQHKDRTPRICAGHHIG